MLQYINRRIDLIFHVKATASLEHQRHIWVNHLALGDNFDEVVHFLFDDSGLADAPEQDIGVILHDELEVEAIRALTQAIDHVLKTWGTQLRDAQYIETPEWTPVLEAAQKALVALKRSEESDTLEYQQWVKENF